MRHAVTLLEVLISIFVLAVGLLGVASLLPVGGFSIRETAKADRSAACGRAALRDIKARGLLTRAALALDAPDDVVPLWLRPGEPGLGPAVGCELYDLDRRHGFFGSGNYRENELGLGEWWIQGTGGWYYVLPTGEIHHVDASGQRSLVGRLGLAASYLARANHAKLHDATPGWRTAIIDPLFIAQHDWATAPAATIGSFPYCNYVTFQDGSSVHQVPRLTTRSQPCTDSDLATRGLSLPTPRNVAALQYTSQDDKVVMKPDDPDARPTLGEIEGNYTWMAMVTPGQDGQCNVSVVVFYKRNLAPTLTLAEITPDNPEPSERVAVATLTTVSPPGVTPQTYYVDAVKLSLPAEPSAARLGAGIVDYLSVRNNDWVLLTNSKHSAWYRVVNVADELVDDARLVTLAGHDWQWGTEDLNADGTAQEVQAVICDEVVGVYQQVIQAD